MEKHKYTADFILHYLVSVVVLKSFWISPLQTNF